MTLHTEAALLQAIANADSLKEQARLVAELDRYRAQRTAAAQEARDIDLSDAIVRDTLSPVAVHTMHTAATDWLDDVAPADETNSHQAMMAEASLWYGRVSTAVKADPDEFVEQATGMARRLAGRYGEGSEGARRAFLDYVAFLRAREAASGLPQIQQLVDSHDNSARTPLPEDTFDTFNDPVAPENVGVDEMQSTENAPLLNEIVQDAQGQGQPEKPATHDTAPDVSHEPGPNYVASQGSVALSHAYDLDQFKADMAAAHREAAATGLKPVRKVVQRVKREAASGLDQVGQVFDAEDNYDPEDPPFDVAFPIVQDWPEMSTQDKKKESLKHTHAAFLQQEALRKQAGFPICAKDDCYWTLSAEAELVNTKKGLAHKVCPTPESVTKSASENKTHAACPNHKSQWYDKSTGDCSCGSNHNRWASSNNPGGYKGKTSTRKQADMFGNSDAGVTPVAGDQVATDPGDIPQDTDGGYSAGVADGRADALAGEKPTFSDASSAVDPYVQGYSEGFGEAANAIPNENKVESVPGGMGGDNGLGNNMASKVASKQPETTKDFAKGYRYASTWKPGQAVVKVGSADFEAGLYAGVTRNPNQKAWVTAHLTWAEKGYPELAQRIAIHRAYTAQLKSQAATSVDLDTMDPDTYPDTGGGTPINGRGTVPPLAGQDDPAAPAGAAPYNGAEPFGEPVAPDPMWLDPQDNSFEGEMPDPDEHRTMAFRKAVQANLVAANRKRAATA